MRRAAAVLGLVVVGAAVWGLVAYGSDLRWYVRVRWRAIAAARREPAALEAWRAEFGDPVATLGQPHGDNRTAVRLRALAASAGVDFATPGDLTPLAVAIGHYVSAEDLKTGGPVGPPPEAVRAYLDAHRPGLAPIVELLASAETPSWKTFDFWDRPPDVPLHSVRQLSEILAAAALADSSRGQDADAERALLAAWQLGASMREHPELVGQSIAEQMAVGPAILARRLAVDAAAWRTRLAERDDRAQMIRALVIHSSLMWSASSSQMARAARADYLDLQRGYLVKMRDLPVFSSPTSTFDETAARRDGWSAGAMVAVMGYTTDVRAVLSANYVMLELELSDRVLQARQLKAHLGRWPAAIPNLETSRIAGVHWIYDVAADGRMSVAVSPALPSIGPPLRFESRQ
jgi:hypothetical protein